MPRAAVEFNASNPWESLFQLIREGQEEIRRLLFFNTLLLGAIAAALGVRLATGGLP